MRAVGVALALGILCVGFAGYAQDEPPPIPLHCIEGCGGVVLTQMAYLVNGSGEDGPVGLPSVSVAYWDTRDKSGAVIAVSETLFNRIELSYGYNWVYLEDFEQELGVDLSHDTVEMHNLNARVMLVEEGGLGLDWMPALTFGLHYKQNQSIKDLNRDVGKALKMLDFQDSETIEASLTATKAFADVLPRPFFVSATARRTDAAQLGWLGFTDDFGIVYEGNVAVLLLDNLIVGAEYRQKRKQLDELGGLIQQEDDWWSIAASYIVNSNLNVTLAFADVGDVINHTDPNLWWLQVKFEF